MRNDGASLGIAAAMTWMERIRNKTTEGFHQQNGEQQAWICQRAEKATQGAQITLP
jgi:hypothetical protein